MQQTFGNRLKKAWNVFLNRDPTRYYGDGPGYSQRPDRVRLHLGNERSIISSIYTRIATDVASTTIQHVRLDDNGRFLDTIDSGLNRCLTVEANIDQTATAFIQDAVMSMFDEGVVALVPIDTTSDPETGSYDVLTLRTAKIIKWNPNSVRLLVHNDRTGLKEEITMLKSNVAIIENPFFAVMNEPNSTLKRLINKLNLLDAIDEQSGSGKLDMIIQVPYAIKSEARKKQAENRRKELEVQLHDSKYGIGYTDGTEKITQLNRPVENNLMGQIEYLTRMLYSQLGMTEGVFDGTASEEEMANYFSRTVKLIVSAIALECHRKFLTQTARTQKHAIRYFRDVFSFATLTQLSEMADKFTRNEILSPNDVRQVVGIKTSADPKSDELRNRNISESKQVPGSSDEESTTEDNQNGG